MTRPWSEAQIALTAEHLKAIAHPLRLAAVCLLGDGERSVGEICERLGTTQPNISQHLAQLAGRKLLKTRRDGSRIYYAIADRRLIDIVEMLRGIYCP